jgi:DNA-binding IclR family transcriptional regulator
MGDFVMAKPPRAAVNSSATHVFEVLRFVAETSEPRGVTDIGRRLSLPVSTVFRALSTLEEAGYIQRYQNAPRFEIGTMPYLLNRALLSRFALHDESRATLYDLTHASEETVSLWVRLGWFAVLIGGAFGRRDTYHNTRLGDTVLLHENPAGRTILAGLTDQERDRYAAFVTQHYKGRLTAPPPQWHHPEGATDIRQERSDMLDFRSNSLVVHDAAGIAVGALASEGPPTEDGPLDKRLSRTRDKIEAMIAANPEAHRSPFAHIDADEIKLDLSKRRHKNLD